MNRLLRKIGAASSLTVAALLAGQQLTADVAVAVETPQRRQGIDDSTRRTPPPVVVTPTREGAQARARDRMVRRKPSIAHKTPRKRVPVAHNRKDWTQRRENPPRTQVEKIELNIGICGRLQPDGSIPGPVRCMPILPEPPAPGRPEAVPSRAVVIQIPLPQDVSWEQVLAESRDIAFPQLGLKVQPAGRTLVNLDTIVYTDQSKVSTATVTLLGFPVVVEATPMSYTWNFGDGASVTTTTPGRPYPAKDITHKYMKKGGVGLTLTTNYAARFNVAGTGWQYVEGLVPITGPVTALQVREAVPVLVEPGR